MKQLLSYFLVSSLFSLCLTSSFAQTENEVDTISYAKEMASQESLIEGQKFFLLEDYESALKSLESALEADPNNDAAYFKQAEIYLKQEKYDEGLTAIEKSLTLQANNKYYYLLASELAALNQQPEKVSDYYLQMLNKTDDYFLYLEEMAKHFIAQGNWQQALEVINYTEGKTNLTVAQYQIKVDILVNANQMKAAQQLLAQLQEKFPGERQFIFQEARLLSLNNQKDEAISLLKAQKELTGEMQLLLAELQGAKVETPEDQKKILLQSFSNPSTDVEIKTVLLGQYLAEGSENVDLMLIDSLQQTLEQNYPEESIVIEHGAKAYEILAQSAEGLQMKAYAMESMERYEKLTQLNPGDFEVWKNLLAQYNLWGNWKRLEIQADEALLRFPNQILFYIHLADAKRELQNINEARSLIRQAQVMANTNPSLKSLAISRMALLAYHEQNTEEAGQLYQEAIGFENPHPEAILAYGTFLSLEKPKEAINFIEPWIRQGAKNEAIFRIKAQALFTLSKFERAKSALEEGNSISSLSSGQSLELLGDIYFKLNNIEKALELWGKAKFLPGVSDLIDQKINEKTIPTN